jgi:TRAP-type C4-dicarboxylate transport system substrate-binding protein
MEKNGALRLLGGACLVFILIATFLSAAHAQKGPGPVKLTMISAWPLTDLAINYSPMHFKKYVEAWSGGQIQVDFKGGPEVVAFPEIPKVVERGVFDIGYTCPPYVGSQYPATQVFNFVNPRNMRLAVRDEKLWDLMDKVTRTHGMTFLGVWQGDIPAFYLFAKKPALDKDGRISSFKGLKIRTPGPFASDFISALGGTPVTMHPGEVYEGIRRKLIDGTMLPMNSAVQGRYWEIIKYLTREGIFLFNSVGFMNANAFDKLSPEHKKIVIEAAKETSYVGYNYVGAITWDGFSSKAGFKDVPTLSLNEKSEQAITKAREAKLNACAAAVPSLSKEIVEKFKAYYGGEDLPISTEVSIAN